MNISLEWQTAVQLSEALSRGEVSSREVMTHLVDRVQKTDGSVRAFLEFDKEDALAQAEAADQRRAHGASLGPLDGIPVAIKDVIAVKGQKLTCASRILEDFICPYDATVTERLRNAGAIVWGRLNMDEFAMGSSTENSARQVTRNPWNLDCIPGGSSGGSAAAVAAGQTPLSLGSDTGGSIRQPASHCGVVGLKPTYGAVSRYGLVAFASSLDQIGPMARTTEDAALLLEFLAGSDERDSTSCQVPSARYREDMRKVRPPYVLGIPREYFGEGLDPEVRESVESAIRHYRELGCELREVSLPRTHLAISTYYILATAEASSNLARYDGIRYTRRSLKATDAIDIYFQSRAEGFGAEVKRRIILGTYVLSSGYYDAYYLRAQKVRTLIRNDFLSVLGQVDAILTPTSPLPAFRIGEKTADPLAMYLSDIYTIGVNLAGLPGVSLPCGFTRNGLPIGLQIIGRPFGEAQILGVARTFEQSHEYQHRHPNLEIS